MATPPPSDNLYMVDLPEGIDDATLKTIFSAYGTVQTLKVLPNPKGGKCAAMVRFQSVEEATWIVENLNGNIPQGLAEAIQVRFANPPGQKGGMKGGAGDGGLAGACGGFGAAGGFKGGASDGGFGKAGGKGWGSPGSIDGGKGFDGCKGKGDTWSQPYPTWGGCKGKGGKGKGNGKGCSINVLHEGLIEAQALPGCATMSNDYNALYINGLPTDTQDVDLYKIFAPFGAIQPKGVRAMANPDGSCKGIGFVNFLDPASMQLAISTLNGTQMPDGSTLTVQPKQQKSEHSGQKGVQKGSWEGK
eukprot:TRINITY_DN41976_c0_g1_i1.p1 TRINITY_DN41976_c0_g1~~TRINITY_DN41976_c0_g1_i1.p1  ORF type:complete len:303 (-),score=52.81 TRINITY_DN41976_c0_g1_i1:96-1004(-)